MITGTARVNGSDSKQAPGTVHVVGRMVTRHQINPIRGLTPVQLTAMLEDSQRGIHSDLQWTYSFLERREPMLRAVKERRLSALGRCTWSVEVDEKAHEDAGMETLADAQKTELEDLIAGIDNLTEATRFLSLATFRGFAHLERVFKDRRLVRLQPVDQWYWCQQYPSLDWLYNKDALATTRGEPIRLDRFVIREVTDPINEAIAIEFLRKKAGQADWDSFNETFGIPNIFGESPENADQAWFDRNQPTLERIISGGRGFLPPGCRVNISEIANGSGAQFENRLKYSDSMIVVCATGGKLTMLADASTGIGKGPSEEHADVFDEIVASEAEDIAEVLQKSIGKKRLDMAFPGQPQLAYLSLSNPAMRVSLTGAQAVSTAKSAGFAIDPEIASEAIGMPLEEGEEPEESPMPGQEQPDPDESMVTNRQAIAEAFTGIASRNLQRFVHRITQAMEDPSDDSRKARLARIRDEFPEMLRTLNRETKLAEYLEDIMGTEFLNGLAGKA